MTTPAQSIQQLREEFAQCNHPQQYIELCSVILDRLETADARIAEFEEEKTAWDSDEAAMSSNIANLNEDRRILHARIDELEFTQQPRPMADAKPVRQLAEWFTAEGMSLGWDTTIWVGRVDMTRGRWSTEGICRPPRSAPRHFLPLPAQSSETCENCGIPDCEPQATDQSGGKRP